MGTCKENQKILIQVKPWLIIQGSNYQAFLNTQHNVAT